LEDSNTKRPDYPIEVYIEKANVLIDFGSEETYQAAQQLYNKAQQFFAERGKFTEQVEILKK
jgi:hypothetical protein